MLTTNALNGRVVSSDEMIWLHEGYSEGSSDFKKQDAVMTTSDREVADVFSECFKEVCIVEDLSNIPKVLDKD